MEPATTKLPAGVVIHDLTMNHDHRGWLTEVYRQSWSPSFLSLQWDAVVSHAGVLRGVHLHRRRTDYLLLLQGKMQVGLRDMRLNSPTQDLPCLVKMDALAQQALIIPPGIAHGIWFAEDSILMYGMNVYWDPDDELGCRWNDPALGIPWPCDSAITSDRDAGAPSYKELLASAEPVYYDT